MRKSLLAVWAACFAAIIVLILLRQRSGAPSNPTDQSASTSSSHSGKPVASASGSPGSPATAGAGTSGAAVGSATANASGNANAIAGSMVPGPRTLEVTNIPAETVVDNLRLVFRNFSSIFGSNPVGTNPEITAALDGGNPKQTKFLKEEDGLRINGKGEVVDPWGTPFFFHQLSGTEMEIHCAGPDGVLWTTDDIVVK